MALSRKKRFIFKMQILYHRLIILVMRFLRNTLRGYLFPRLFFSKEVLEFPEGDISILVKEGKQSSSKKIVILMYNSQFGLSLMHDPFSLPDGFEITTDRRRMAEAHAVVFHIPTLGLIRHLRKLHGQLWVAWSMECETHYPRWQSPRFMKQFDLTMSYHLDADVPIPYLFPGFETSTLTPPKPKKKGNLVSYFASNYNEQSGRTRYVIALMKTLDVHSYGRCLRTRGLSGTHHPFDEKMETQSSYKFDLAFENAIARDYVTEKFFHPFRVGIVPVYLGAPNVEEFSPGKKSFINTADFQSPQELAEHLLWLDNNDDAYQEYFQWKRHPLNPSFLKIISMQKDHVFVRLFYKIKEVMG